MALQNAFQAHQSQSDLKTILSAVPNIEASAIKDLHWLGKFNNAQDHF